MIGFPPILGFRYNLRSKSRGIVLLVAIWLLMTVVLANGYAGTLFSFLTITKLTQPINSLQELANATDVQLLTHVRIFSMFFKSRLMKSWNANLLCVQVDTDINDKLLTNMIKAHPENRFNLDGRSETKKLMTGKYAMAFVRWNLAYFMNWD